MAAVRRSRRVTPRTRYHIPALFEEVLGATGVPVTITDPNQPDNPLVWVNDAFLATTGYSRAEVTGRNCRFLQGPETDPKTVAAVRDAVENGRGITVTVLNYRKDGSAFWNRLRVDPVPDATGHGVAAFVGVQADVSAEVEALGDPSGSDPTEGVQLVAQEHLVAATLQHRLLPTLPELEDFEAGARYVTAERHAQVGGDFYEVLPLPDGSIGVAVGDVVGHDIAAAATMGQLRGLIRSVAWTCAEDDHLDPVEVLDRTDRLAQHLELGAYASVFYGRLSHRADTRSSRRADPGEWQLDYATAGHPPPLLRHPDGQVAILDGARGILLGVTEVPRRTTATATVRPGAILLAFTDGLVERAGESLDAGYERVIAHLAAGGASIEALLDDIVAQIGPGRVDDAAALLLRLRH